MTVENQTPSEPAQPVESQVVAQPERGGRSGYVAGAALIIIGALVLFNQLTDATRIENYILPAVGLILLTWGVLVRTIGLVIPGSLLFWIGVTLILVEGQLQGSEDLTMGAWTLLGIAVGFFGISVVWWLTTREKVGWPFIPGTILAIIAMVMFLGEESLELLSDWWPLLLLLGGVLLILRQVFRGKQG